MLSFSATSVAVFLAPPAPIPNLPGIFPNPPNKRPVRAPIPPPFTLSPISAPGSVTPLVAPDNANLVANPPGPKKGNILRPKAIPSAIREEGIKKASGVKVDLTEAAKAAKEYIKRVPIADTGPIRKTLETLTKQKTVSLKDAFQRLSEWGPLTYKPSGLKNLLIPSDPKTTATGQVYNILYGNIRNQIAQKAPLASAGQTGLAGVNKIGGALGNLLKYSLIGGALGAGGAAIGGGVVSKLFPGLTQR